MTLDHWRPFYADEIRIAAGIDSPGLIAAYARVARERLMGSPPWQVTSQDLVSMAFMG